MPPPSPSRRDESSPAAGHDGPPPPCDCGGCREFRAIRAGFSLEVPYGARLAKRERDRLMQRYLEEVDLAPGRRATPGTAA